ncbi:bifunctional cobalt-precorrin-7 (C(5))-methyltransferase/cobalt-precorrin-6B (C(15))-methyltransferase [Methylobacter luteus]|uniref:bifunctional cobalt-precorrin-7 (C(5))-methyltransferase/cobalt-precorrin-6B (C(15))-methyltransferase n=1 Tax=Methylobacter luteus TaxID=415 RepID=UPI00041A6379|nr:bifunctional cobalt-precorrin-7 (C(5))-methyltransferase/cobalt-precorrin-6B (C(15))-methyltransferase [Methylobacter luteus]
MQAMCSFIGVLDSGAASLSQEALLVLREAKYVIAGHRLLHTLADDIAQAKHYDLTGQLKQVPDWINAALARNEAVAVLATGDPLCHGIAGFLVDKLDPNRVRILPNLSTIQLAFAELKLSWQSAKIVSVHSRDTGEWTRGAMSNHGLYELAQRCRQQDLLAILTSPDNTAARIARLLQIEGLANVFEMAIAEALKQQEQRVSAWLTIAEVAQNTYRDPNVVILKRKTAVPTPVLFGVSDDRFQQRKPEKGLITKREVRAVSLARMQLTRSSIIWDIGAGSGSVGLEAARLCPDGHVFSVEKNADDIANVAQNQATWGISNYSFVHGKAPQCLDTWPDPDAVFIGGSGGELAELIALCLGRLRPAGWLVMNFVTLENLSAAVDTLKQLGADWDVCQIQASRSSPILKMHRLQAENPVWIVSATNPLQPITSGHDEH